MKTAIIAAILCLNAHAYQFFADHPVWYTREITVRINVGFPADILKQVKTGVRKATLAWSKASGRQIIFRFTKSEDADVQVWYAADISEMRSTNALAETWLKTKGNLTSFASVSVNARYARDFSVSTYDMSMIMVHEFGHVLGLDHSFGDKTCMWPYYNPLYKTPGADDVTGISWAYGLNIRQSRAISTRSRGLPVDACCGDFHIERE